MQVAPQGAAELDAKNVTDPSATERGALLVIGSGCQACREYGLRSMASRYRLIIADDAPPSWQVAFASEHITVPLTGSGPLLSALTENREGAGPIAGVVTYIEQYLPIAAEVAAALGLRYSSVQAINACRDKLMTRRQLAAAGVPSAQSFPVGTLDEARQAAAAIGYPVVVKPRLLAGGLGVTFVATQDELERAYALGDGSRLEGVDGMGGLLIEQYLDGPQISVECVSSAGRSVAAALTEHTVEAFPHFEQGGHLLDASAEFDADRAAATEVALAALAALEFTDGVSHVELRLTSAGPRIIEVNGRLAGGRIPYLWRLASGVDIALAAADVAVGAVPDLVPTRREAAAIKHLYPPVAGRVVSLGAQPDLRAQPWFHDLVWEKVPGDLVKPPPNAIYDRLGFLIVTGPDAGTCRKRLERANNSLEVNVAREVAEQCV